MTEAEFVDLIQTNPINAAILDRLPELQAVAPQVHLTAGSLFQTVWNLKSGLSPQANIKDYDLFYRHPDTSYEAEDAVIQMAAKLFADLHVPLEIRNQARVHLWFNPKYNLERPSLTSAREGISQFLVECTCLGIDDSGDIYAPYGLDDMAIGITQIE